MKAFFFSSVCLLLLNLLFASTKSEDISETLINLSQSMADLITDRIWDFKHTKHIDMKTWLKYSHYVLSVGVLAETNTVVAANSLDYCLFNYYHEYINTGAQLPFSQEPSPNIESDPTALSRDYIKKLKFRQSFYNLYALKATGRCDSDKYGIFLELTAAQGCLLLNLGKGSWPSSKELNEAFSEMAYMREFFDLALCVYSNQPANEQFRFITQDTVLLKGLLTRGLSMDEFYDRPSWNGLALYIASRPVFCRRPQMRSAFARAARPLILREMIYANSSRNRPEFPEHLRKNLFGNYVRAELEAWFCTSISCLKQLIDIFSREKRYFGSVLDSRTIVPSPQDTDFIYILNASVQYSCLEHLVSQIDLTNPSCLELIATLLRIMYDIYCFNTRTFFYNEHMAAFADGFTQDMFVTKSSDIEVWCKLADEFEDYLRNCWQSDFGIGTVLLHQLYSIHMALTMAKLAWIQHGKDYEPDSFVQTRHLYRLYPFYNMGAWVGTVVETPKLVKMEEVERIYEAFRGPHSGNELSSELTTDPYVCKAMGWTCQYEQTAQRTLIQKSTQEEGSKSASTLQEAMDKNLRTNGKCSSDDEQKSRLRCDDDQQRLIEDEKLIPKVHTVIGPLKSIHIEFDVEEAGAQILGLVQVEKMVKEKIGHSLNGPMSQAPKLLKTQPTRSKKLSELAVAVPACASSISDSSSECESDSLIETIDSSFLNNFLHRSDRGLLEKHDVRDVLFSYLIIGNYVYVRYISRLLTYLKEWNNDMMASFLASPSEFFKEFSYFADFYPTFAAEALSKTDIPNMDFLENCIGFYERRLMVTHPYVPKHPSIVKSVFKNFVAMLKRSNSGQYPSGSRLFADIHWGGISSLGYLGEIEAISDDYMRPDGFPDHKRIEYMIALLALHEIGTTEPFYKACNFASTGAWSDVRNEVAHLHNAALYLPGAMTVFKETEHKGFLSLIYHSK